ncbi:MAG: efflux RND transporter periplasmic adaptor subunit [Phycisphaerales bacterium]|nr:MAG: efflux RND transporter periplasmic adaptor subunit [Phycisphaerales bacterium]
MRWCVVLAVIAVLATWSTYRIRAAAARLSGTLTAAEQGGAAEANIEYWTCSMHPDVREAEPGDCPRCGMRLIPKYFGSDQPGVIPVGATVDRPARTPRTRKLWYMCTMPECGDVGSDDPASRCPVCGMKREPVPLDSGGDETEEAEISLSAHARRLAGLATEPVARRNLYKRIRTVGKVTYDETRRRMVSAWTGGRIDRLFADFTGMVVSKGDHLVEIYSPELISAQEELLQALRTLGAMEADALEPSRRRAEGMVASARQKLELLGVTERQIGELERTGETARRLVVHAPLGGTIIHKSAMEGMYVRTGDPLYEIADLTQVWLLLDLYEADLPWIVPFQDVKVTAQSLPGEEFLGRIVFVDPLVDKTTRTIKVRVNVENPDRRLKPEMFVTAEIDVVLGEAGRAAAPGAPGAYACPMHPWETGDTLSTCPICEMDMVSVESLPGYTSSRPAVPVLSVPSEAVMRTGERTLVYVETEPGVYRGVEIRVGPAARDETGRRFYPVLDGLSEGQAVVTRGNFVIDSQMQITGKPSLFSVRGFGAGSARDHGGHHAPADAGKGALGR